MNPGKWADRLRAKVLEIAGSAGSVAPSRYVGATVSGTPTSGTYAVGDWGVTHAGSVWVCRVAGVAGSTAAFSSTVSNNLNETVSGTKTFSSAPVVPSLTIGGLSLTVSGSDLYLDGQRLAKASELAHDHTGTYATPATNTTTTHSHP